MQRNIEPTRGKRWAGEKIGRAAGSLVAHQTVLKLSGFKSGVSPVQNSGLSSLVGLPPGNSLNHWLSFERRYNTKKGIIPTQKL